MSPVMMVGQTDTDERIGLDSLVGLSASHHKKKPTKTKPKSKGFSDYTNASTQTCGSVALSDD